MPAICKTCEAPDKVRDLIERLRTAGISYRDTADTVKAIRQYDISHAAIQRHEVEGHFSPGAVIANNMPIVKAEDLTLRTIIDRKIELWWNSGGKDEIPNAAEVRNWLKLWADLKQAETEADKVRTLKDAFKPALPKPELPAIEGQIIEPVGIQT